MEENRTAAQWHFSAGSSHDGSYGGHAMSAGNHYSQKQAVKHNYSLTDVPFIDEDDTPTDQHTVLLHSDTQFDSSTDETVVPFMIGERQSQEQLGEKFDPESSPKSHLSRLTRRSQDTDQCGTLYEESTEQHIEIIQDNSAMARRDELESQQLMTSTQQTPPKKIKRSETADYRVGSCYHCLVSVPVGSLLSWIFLFISVLGWSVATYLSMFKGKMLLEWIQSDETLQLEEICVIAIALATVLLSAIFLIVATFSSEKMSRYHLNSSRKNTLGYCLSITEVVFASISIVFWTGIISLTMIPVAALTIIHVLVESQNMDCLHLPSYGVGLISATPSVITEMMTTSAQLNTTSMTTAMMTNMTTVMPMNNNVTAGVQAMMNTSTAAVDNSTVSGLLCGSDLDDWASTSWRVMITLLISLGFAVAVEISMIGFLVAASNNTRHLRERMEYINEPYSYSTENVNGNIKPIVKDNGNNNITDTQI